MRHYGNYSNEGSTFNTPAPHFSPSKDLVIKSVPTKHLTIDNRNVQNDPETYSDAKRAFFDEGPQVQPHSLKNTKSMPRFVPEPTQIMPKTN
jgi:hypothetical protein